MNIFTDIGNFFKDIFTKRSERIKAAKAIAGVLKQFANNTTAINVITYAVETLAPTSTTFVNIAKSFIINGAPVLFNALDLMDASDDSSITEDNIESVYKEFNTLGTVVSESDLKACISKYIKNDGKLSLAEALELLREYRKSDNNTTNN